MLVPRTSRASSGVASAAWFRCHGSCAGLGMTQPNTSAPLLSKFVAYQLALESAQAVAVASARWRGWAHLADQARRATCSVALNLAEGNAFDFGSPARRKFQIIAFGSAREVECALELAAKLGLGDARELAKAQALASRVAAILTKLCRPG